MDFLILTVLTLFGTTVALAGEHCSYEDAAIVMRQWNHVLEHGEKISLLLRFSDFTTEKFFEGNPPSMALFSRVNVADVFSAEWYAFAMRFYTTLTELINKLHSPEVLDSMLEHLNSQHVARPGLKKEHFHAFDGIFKLAAREYLDEYNPDAWDNCMRGILEGMSRSLPP